MVMRQPQMHNILPKNENTINQSTANHTIANPSPVQSINIYDALKFAAVIALIQSPTTNLFHPFSHYRIKTQQQSVDTINRPKNQPTPAPTSNRQLNSKPTICVDATVIMDATERLNKTQ